MNATGDVHISLNLFSMQKPTTLLLIFLLFFSFHNAVQSQAIAATFPEKTVSVARLGKYDAFLADEVKKGTIPGAVSYIMKNGQLVHNKAYGYSNLNDKTPMREDQILHIMSMTKPIVTVAFMMLYEEGNFSLTDPVSKYLPQFKDLHVALDADKGLDSPTVPTNNEVTIHQVLTHTAGFSHGLGGTELDNAIANALYGVPQKSIESRVNTLVGLPLIGQPGEQWYYSASPDVLSLLIEHFSGMTTAEFLKKRLFDPLGMKDTAYNIDTENQDRWGPVHNRNDDGKMVKSEEQLPISGNTVYGGSHGLFSTASDYMLFCQMLLNNGTWKGTQYLGPKTIEIMTMNQVGDLYQAPGQGFGLGFGITTNVAKSKGLGSVGQYYWSGAYCTYFFIDPAEKLIAILMTQVQPYNNYYGTIMRQFIYQSLID